MLAHLPFAAILVVAAVTQCMELRMAFSWEVSGSTGGVCQAAPCVPESSPFAYLKDRNLDGVLYIDLGSALFPGHLSRFSYGALMGELLGLSGARAMRLDAEDFLLGTEPVANISRRAGFPFLAADIEMGVTTDSDSTLPVRASMELVSGSSPLHLVALMGSGSRTAPRTKSPVEALEGAVAAVSPAQVICLMDEALLRSRPELLSVSGVSLFVVGVMGGSQKSVVVRQFLSDGRNVVFVPPFREGILEGTLRLDAEGAWEPVDGTWNHVPQAKMLGSPESRLRVTGIVQKWERLYAQETGNLLRKMDSPLASGGAGALGNFLLEWSGAELAILDRSSIGDGPLPQLLRLEDLDRLLLRSSDLVSLRLRGKQVRSLAGNRDLLVTGFQDGEIEGRRLREEHPYSILATEEALSLMRTQLGTRIDDASVHYHLETDYQVLKDHLASRSRTDYDFGHLKKRWRLWGEPSMEASVRQVIVGNPDSLRELSSAAPEPFSAWSGDLRIPISIGNSRQQFDLSTKIQYAAANDRVGRNELEMKADYSFGPQAEARAYASSTYQGFALPPRTRPSPARLRTAVGFLSQYKGWKAKLGAGAQKSLETRSGYALAPLTEFWDEAESRWRPAVEASLEGAWDAGAWLRRRKPEFWKHRSLKLRFTAEELLTGLPDSPRNEIKSSLELEAELLQPLQFRLGYQYFHAHFFENGQGLWNSEPRFSLASSFPFKF